MQLVNKLNYPSIVKIMSYGHKHYQGFLTHTTMKDDVHRKFLHRKKGL